MAETPRTESPITLTISRPGSSYDVVEEQENEELQEEEEKDKEMLQPEADMTTPPQVSQDEEIATIERGETLVEDETEKRLTLPKVGHCPMMVVVPKMRFD